jgi:hypothetical protein
VTYPTVDQLLATSDLPETDFPVTPWGVTLRVRPPSLEQQEQIIRHAQLVAARQARKDAQSIAPDFPWQALMPDRGYDWLTFCVKTLRLCVTCPVLTDAQAQQMKDKNPHAVEQLVNFIWDRGKLSGERIRAIVQEHAGPDPAADTQAAAVLARTDD